MRELITRFQAMAFEMYVNGLLNEREFAILEALTENMETDNNALELAATLTMKDLEGENVVERIIAREFKDVYIAKICPWDVVI
jgi:hypothetical protein